MKIIIQNKNIVMGILLTLILVIFFIMWLDYNSYKNKISTINCYTWPYNIFNFAELKKDSNNKIKVAILDTGIDLSHKCFDNLNILSINVYDDSQTDNIHGTQVAGIICSSKFLNTSKKIINNIEFLSIRIGSDNHIDVNDIINGLEIALKNKVDIINICIGTYGKNDNLNDLINVAINDGIIVVCSNGNDATKQNIYPASFDGVISVSSIDSNNNYLLNNNINNKIITCAPGERIPTGIYNKNHQMIQVNGTSASTALITSLIISLKSIYPQINSNNILKIIKNSSQDLGKPGKDEYYGYGIIDYKKAVLYMHNKIMTALFY